jgi:hypothetical protein
VVDGKLESVRDLFVAMAGFDDNTLDHLSNVARGSRNNLILMDRVDLLEVLEGASRSTQRSRPRSTRPSKRAGCWWLPLGR